MSRVARQHVGTQSDALVPDADLEAVRASMAAAKAAVKPRGQRYTGVSRMGDGDWCPVEGHGRMYVLDRGTQWCPHQTHDMQIKNVTPRVDASTTMLDISAMEV